MKTLFENSKIPGVVITVLSGLLLFVPALSSAEVTVTGNKCIKGEVTALHQGAPGKKRNLISHRKSCSETRKLLAHQMTTGNSFPSRKATRNGLPGKSRASNNISRS